jgi:uncharacterized protein (TIGR02265 family)
MFSGGRDLKQVKGSAMVHFVKAIRANKSGIYNKYFQKEDLEIIMKPVLPAFWYPYETYKRCFNAVFEVAAKKDYEKVKEWARAYAELIMTDIYKHTIKKDNPLDHIRNAPIYIQTFYNFGHAEAKVEGPNRVLLNLSDYDSDFAPFYFFHLGWFQRVAELCGAQNVKCEFLEMSWITKSNTTSFLITWK